jgi:alpha-1,2-mannosyltransferase
MRALGWVVAAVIAVAVVYLIVAPGAFHWDFRVYVRASDTWLHGGDPYAVGDDVTIGFVTAKLPFVYPPITLAAFAPFALLPEPVAIAAWLAIELAAAVLLVRVWRRFVPFAPSLLDARLALLLLFAFNAALYTALASGNVALLEALALYAGFDALLAQRPGRFAALVVAAAAFKVLPALFLAFLLVWGGPRRWRALAGALLALAVIAAITYALAPGYLHAAAATLDERRWTNPTVLAMLRDLADRTGVALPAVAIWLASAAVMLAITSVRIARTRPPARMLVPLIFVVAALVLPRFKSYSYVELIPAAIVALRAVRGPARFALAVLLGAVLPWSYLLVASPAACRALEHALPVSRYVWGYVPLLAAFVVWMIYLAHLPDARRP